LSSRLVRVAALLDGGEEVLDELRVVADRRQRQLLLEWAAQVGHCPWVG
jgi:hypothetical protein